MSPAKALKKTTKKVAKKPTLANRVDLLEHQVKYLLEKVSILEVPRTKTKDLGDSSQVREIKQALVGLLKSGDSLTIDEIAAQPSLQQYPLEALEKAVIGLVDDEIFDVSEGISKLKVGGNISRIIMR